MSVIIKQPPALTQVGNIEPIEIASSLTVQFQLKLGSVTLLDETYKPSPGNRVNVDIRAIVNDNLQVAVPTSDIYHQEGAVRDFTCIIDGQSLSFKAIKGGVDQLGESPSSWLLSNWLTWRPQVSYVSHNVPCWLSYYATQSGLSVKVRGYFSDSTNSVATIATLTSGSFTTLNVSLERISGLFPKAPGAYDIWVQDSTGAVKTYVQRFIYERFPSRFSVFVFVNSLGGIDTLVCKGITTIAGKYTPETAYFGEELMESHLDNEQTIEQNTGLLETAAEREWIPDFFASEHRWVEQKGILKPIVLRESKTKFDNRNILVSANFSYTISKRSGYLNISRGGNLGDVLEIVDPEGTLFFLKPRLIDFQSIAPTNEVVLPAMRPLISQWFRVSLGDIYDEMERRIQIPETGSGYGKVLFKTTNEVGSTMTYALLLSFFGAEQADESIDIVLINSNSVDVEIDFSPHASLYCGNLEKLGYWMAPGEAKVIKVYKSASGMIVVDNLGNNLSNN